MASVSTADSSCCKMDAFRKQKKSSSPGGLASEHAFQVLQPTTGTFPLLGVHNHPHIGVYSDFYFPFIPSVAIELPQPEPEADPKGDLISAVVTRLPEQVRDAFKQVEQQTSLFCDACVRNARRLKRKAIRKGLPEPEGEFAQLDLTSPSSPTTFIRIRSSPSTD